MGTGGGIAIPCLGYFPLVCPFVTIIGIGADCVCGGGGPVVPGEAVN